VNNYSSEDIENYILLGYEPKKGRSIPKNMLLTSLKLNVFAVIFLAIAVVTITDNFNINELILVAVIVFLILVSVALGIGFNHWALRNNVKRNFQQGTDVSAGTGRVAPSDWSTLYTRACSRMGICQILFSEDIRYQRCNYS